MIVGVIFTLAWPFVFQITQPQQNLGNVRQDGFIIAVEWIALIVLLVIVVLWERLPALASVGIVRPAVLDVAVMFGLVVLAAALVASFSHAHLRVPKSDMLAQALGLPLALRAGLVFTAGVCEEAFFRGYLIERLRRLTGNIWSGAFLGTIFFTLGHIPRYGLSAELLDVALSGAILSSLYAWRRNLLPCIVLHWLVDGINLIALPAFVSSAGK